MSTTMNPCCAPLVVPTRRPVAQRWLDTLRGTVSALWQHLIEQRRLAAERQALLELSDATLRDLGLGERRYDEPTPGRVDWERGRWQ
jgi:uncharacterized protein YjiS (DUF1127 family)